MQKSLPYIVIAIVIIFLAFLLFYPRPSSGGIVLYYGQECPHCKRVEEFLQQNKIDEKVKIERKEVYHNQSNAARMAQTAAKCGIASQQIGVPFLWDGKSCYIGEDQIMNFFQPYVNADAKSSSTSPIN